MHCTCIRRAQQWHGPHIGPMDDVVHRIHSIDVTNYLAAIIFSDENAMCPSKLDELSCGFWSFFDTIDVCHSHLVVSCTASSPLSKFCPCPCRRIHRVKLKWEKTRSAHITQTPWRRTKMVVAAPCLTRDRNTRAHAHAHDSEAH